MKHSHRRYERQEIVGLDLSFAKPESNEIESLNSITDNHLKDEVNDNY